MYRSLAVVIALIISSLSFSQSNLLLDLVKDYRAGRVTTWHSTASLSGRDLAVDFRNTATYPTVKVTRTTPANWSAYDAFLIDVVNPEVNPTLFYLRIDNSLSANGLLDCRTGWAYAEPGQRKTFAFPLRLNPAHFGMKALPGLRGSTWLSMNNSVLNISNVVRWQINLVSPQVQTRLIFSSPRLVRMDADLNEICDKWGQYVDANWPGKVHSDTEFAQYNVQEQLDLIANPELADRDAKGGWTKGVNFTASGRFKTVKYLNNWWLATPEGWPFLSFGMNAAGNTDPTITSGREYMYQWLPSPTDPMYQFHGRISDIIPGSTIDGDTFNFLKANLYRKFGDNLVSSGYTRTLDRMKSWGFNTLGSWSIAALWSRQVVPYTVISQIGQNHMTISVDPLRTSMHDPFDTNFRADVRQGISAVGTSVLNDPWCVGWFLDNEPTLSGGVEENGRYGIAYGVLKQSVFSSPAKVVFLTDLQDKYGTIQSLNSAWQTTFSNWEALAFPVNLPDQNGTTARKADFQAFCLKFQQEYFRIMDDELFRVDDRALNLGARFFRFTTETLTAASQYCDVLSFNIYATSLSAQWSNYSLINKPFMVSEFHFGALDRGMFHPGLVAAVSQAQRATFFKGYVRSIVDNPQFVGCHWHQYYDQPLTGRVINGENYNEGFVNAADFPYPELVGAAREVFGEAYSRRWALN